AVAVTVASPTLVGVAERLPVFDVNLVRLIRRAVGVAVDVDAHPLDEPDPGRIDDRPLVESDVIVVAARVVHIHDPLAVEAAYDTVDAALLRVVRVRPA